MSKSGGEISPGCLRTPRVASQRDDVIARLKELRAHGDEALKVLEEAAKEIVEDVVEADIDAANASRMTSGLPLAS